MARFSVLVANKYDLPRREWNLTTEDGETLAKAFKIPYIETSAKDNHHVDTAFIELARKCQIMAKQKPQPPSNSGSKIPCTLI